MTKTTTILNSCSISCVAADAQIQISTIAISTILSFDEYYFASKSFAAVCEAISNTSPDKNKIR